VQVSDELAFFSREEKMVKAAMIAASFLIAVAYTSRPAYSDDNPCPDRDWDEVKRNLERTVTDPGAKSCVYVKIQSGSSNAYGGLQRLQWRFQWSRSHWWTKL